MKFFYLYSAVIVAILLTACDFWATNSEENIIARVGDKYLYKEDIQDIRFAEGADSAQMIKNFVDNWVKEQLLVLKAIENLKEDQVNFEEQLDNYRRSLIIYTYENLLIQQKLDTLITDDQIEVYYHNNPGNFELREMIYQLRLIKIKVAAPNQDSLKMWLFDRDSTQIAKLENYCTTYAIFCHLDTTNWLAYSELKEYLPDSLKQSELQLSNGSNVMGDSTETVFVDLFNTKKSGRPAPVSFVTEEIRSIIKNQRRLKLLATVRQQIYEEADLKEEYEVYY